MAPSTVNVAALHFLKKRDAKSSAEFFRLEETRLMGESGQDVVAAIGCSMASAQLVTVLSALNRAVSTAVAKGGATAATEVSASIGAAAAAAASTAAASAAAAVELTGVAAPGATRRDAFDRFDILHTR